LITSIKPHFLKIFYVFELSALWAWIPVRSGVQLNE